MSEREHLPYFVAAMPAELKRRHDAVDAGWLEGGRHNPATLSMSKPEDTPNGEKVGGLCRTAEQAERVADRARELGYSVAIYYRPRRIRKTTLREVKP